MVTGREYIYMRARKRERNMKALNIEMFIDTCSFRVEGMDCG